MGWLGAQEKDCKRDAHSPFKSLVRSTYFYFPAEPSSTGTNMKLPSLSLTGSPSASTLSFSLGELFFSAGFGLLLTNFGQEVRLDVL